MAWADVVTQVLWSGASTVSLGPGGSQTSDLVSISGGAVERWLRIKAKTGAAEAGKKIELHVLAVDDVDADAADDADTQHTLVGTLALDTIPATGSFMVEVPPGITGIQIRVDSTAATATYDVSVVLHERTWN